MVSTIIHYNFSETLTYLIVNDITNQPIKPSDEAINPFPGGLLRNSKSVIRIVHLSVRTEGRQDTTFEFSTS